ncbi:oligosaccharide flippase family protein [Alphaproteobacteria bacterium]|nr:oligosaccharide flippase family protein [Alphaproteobacteria bacterium]
MAVEVFGSLYIFFNSKFGKLSKTSKGGISLSIIEFFRYLSEFCIILITARLLSPNDFGLVAISISFISIIDALTDIGIKTAVIQNREKNLEFLSCAWFLIILRALFVFILLLLFSHQISVYFDKPEIEIIIKILALRTILQALINPYQMYNIKSLEYKNYTIMMIISTLSKLVIIIPIAIIVQNYWVLIIGSLISPFIKVIISYYLDRRFLMPKINIEKAKIILKFSLWMLLSRFALITKQNIPRLVMAKSLDFSFVGGFKLSEQLGYFINNILKKFSSMIILPYFSKKFRNSSKNKTNIAEEYISFIISVVFPICILATISAEALIYIFFGEKWYFIKNMLICMIIYGGFLTVSNMLFTLVVAYGKPSIESKSRILSLIILILFIVFDHSLNGILNALLISGFVMLVLSIIDLFRLKIIKILLLAKYVIIDNISVSGILITLYFYNNFFGSIIIDFLLFNIIAILFYMFIAIFTHYFLRRGIVTYIKNFLY